MRERVVFKSSAEERELVSGCGGSIHRGTIEELGSVRRGGGSEYALAVFQQASGTRTEQRALSLPMAQIQVASNPGKLASLIPELSVCICVPLVYGWPRIERAAISTATVVGRQGLVLPAPFCRHQLGTLCDHCVQAKQSGSVCDIILKAKIYTNLKSVWV